LTLFGGHRVHILTNLHFFIYVFFINKMKVNLIIALNVLFDLYHYVEFILHYNNYSVLTNMDMYPVI